MCGIFGFWLNRPLTDADVMLGRNGVSALSYRGPDGEGEWIDRAAGVFLGHRRLAILDLSSAGAQPMRRGAAVVTYNGEIYNFSELREELAAFGERFFSNSDTEVLLAAWNRWGAGSLDRLDGMFAFALFDGRQLFLATDPFGEKPLYVASTADGFYFASEPGPLITLLGLSFQPSDAEVRQFLALGFIPPPGTGYPGLAWLPPATLRTYETPHRSQETVYWRPREEEGRKLVIDEADVDRLRDILVTSLRRRARADVPLGLFLSSGVDSALIGALAARELGMPLKSLTVAFSDGEDESEYAAKIARHLGLPHVVIDSRQGSRWQDLPATLADLFAVPNDNVTALSIEQMSHLARAELTVVLGGAGGDEAFFGYNKYAFIHRNSLAYRLPPTIVKRLKPLGMLSSRLATAIRLLAGSPVERFIALKNGELGRLMESGAFVAPPLPAFSASGRNTLSSVRLFDVAQTLPASYLASIDRGSMRASIEVRTPYLARTVFDFSAEFSQVALMAGGQKTILRRLLLRYLPQELVDRPKRGFVFPLKRYLESVSCPPPALQGLAPSTVAELWRRRTEPGVDVIVLRLLILRHFLQQ